MRRVLLSAGLGLTICAGLAIPVGAQRDPGAVRQPVALDVAESPHTAPRPIDVRPVDESDLDVISLRCEAADAAVAARCAWRPTNSEAAIGYQLWRIVDRGDRELVWRGGLDETSARDALPADTTIVRYAVLAVDEEGEVVGQSRPATLRFVDGDDDPVRDVRRVHAVIIQALSDR